MKFLDFIIDRVKYAVVYFINTVVVILVIYLSLLIKDGKVDKWSIIYAFLLSIAIFLFYLIYDYIKTRSFYKNLNMLLKSDTEINQVLSIENVSTREEKIFKEVLFKIYRLHNDKIVKYEENQKHYNYFLNQWVHQMKTPVSVINLLLEDTEEKDYKSTLLSIEEENQKISNGLEMVLYDARLKQFSLDFTVESFDIIPIIRGVINENKKSLIKNRMFPKIVGEKKGDVETDKKWIVFVVNQILINAIKYSKVSQDKSKSIIFELRKEGEKTTLSIEDEGIGIPKEDINRVFRAFFTGKNGRKTSESTGMGLYLSKEICDRLGHDLLLKSEVGVGSKFTIVFYRGKNIFKI